jgi:hypothetical protein
MARSQVLYAKVARKIRSDRKYRSLSLHAAYAWDGLLTSEHQNGLPGFWRASESVLLADDLPHLSRDQWQQARAELEAAGMLRIDDAERLVWLVNAVRAEYNSPDNVNIARSWARKLSQYDTSSMLVEYLKALILASEHWARETRAAFYTTLEEFGIDTADPETRRPVLLSPEAPTPKPIREVFDHWVQVMQHPGAFLDKKRERVIRAALKERSVEDCKRAIDGCKASAFHMGENDRGKVYDSLGLIFRDAEHTERFLGYLTDPSGNPADSGSDLYRFDE